MALADDIETIIGAIDVKKMTTWDSQTALVKDSSRWTLFIQCARGYIEDKTGLIEPTDATTAAYGRFLALMVLRVRWEAAKARSATSETLKGLHKDLVDEMGELRDRTYIEPATNSAVVVEDEKEVADFPRSHWNDYLAD